MLLCTFYATFVAVAQSPQTQFKGFGHQEFTFNTFDSANGYFTIGEHDFFVTSKLSKNISFLGEYVIRYNAGSGTRFLPSIERSFIKFNYYKNHSIIAGKIHTPLNYWNDVYHHGRVFFPTIDRPYAFSHLIPLHKLGIQFQGQNLGRYNFGYDIALGNGIASTDVKDDALPEAITAAFHFKPVDGMRVGASHFYDFLQSNIYGTHSGHTISPINTGLPIYKGPLTYNLTCFSFAYFGKKLEVLNEFALNATRTDSLGRAVNKSNYLYTGLRIKEKHVPYMLFDVINVAENDLHTYHMRTYKLAAGYRDEFSHLINLKFQVERQWDHSHPGSTAHRHENIWNFKLQLAYGF